MHLPVTSNAYTSVPPPSIEEIEELVLNKKAHQGGQSVHRHARHHQTGSPEVLNQYVQAMRYTENKEWRKALEAYEKLLEFLPRNNEILAPTYDLIALSYSKLGEHETAVKYSKKAVKLAPNDYDIRLALGLEYLLLRQSTNAIQVFKDAWKLDKKRYEAHFYLGYLYTTIRQWDRAIRHYRESIQLKEEFTPSHIYLADLYTMLGRQNPEKREKFFSEAIKVYQRFLKLIAQTPAVLNNLGVLFSQLGDDKAALNAYQEALEQDPSNEIVQKNLYALKNAIVKKRLLEKGSLKRVPEPITDVSTYRNRKLIQVKGKPLSQTIIEERR